MLRSISLRDADVSFDPDFLKPQEANHFLAELQKDVDWEQRSIKMFGRSVPQPRLTAWYGDMDYTYSGLRWAARPWPTELKRLEVMVEGRCGEAFNSVLANLYRDGRDSVGWHSDDERALGRDPVIASVSLGASRMFHMEHKKEDAEWKILLTHGSLLLMKGTTQHCWKHALPKDKAIQELRINLTFRHIYDGEGKPAARVERP